MHQRRQRRSVQPVDLDNRRIPIDCAPLTPFLVAPNHHATSVTGVMPPIVRDVERGFTDADPRRFAARLPRRRIASTIPRSIASACGAHPPSPDA
jgi:hypothetical protein